MLMREQYSSGRICSRSKKNNNKMEQSQYSERSCLRPDAEIQDSIDKRQILRCSQVCNEPKNTAIKMKNIYINTHTNK